MSKVRYEFDWDPAKTGMKDEFDFSKGERGKFFRGELEFSPPVHLAKGVTHLSSVSWND